VGNTKLKMKIASSFSGLSKVRDIQVLRERKREKRERERERENGEWKGSKLPFCPIQTGFLPLEDRLLKGYRCL
jgi:hypothetical protein